MPEMQIDGYELERLQEAKGRKGAAEEMQEVRKEVHNEAEGRDPLISDYPEVAGVRITVSIIEKVSNSPLCSKLNPGMRLSCLS